MKNSPLAVRIHGPLLILLLISLAWPGFSGAAGAATLQIQASVGDGGFQSGPIHPLAGETGRLRLKPEGLQQVRWYMIVPDLTVQYQNANFPWEDPPYRWRGHARIRYARVEIPAFAGRTGVRFTAGKETFAPPPSPTAESGFWQTAAGTFFFQAEATKDGRKYSSPGIDSADSLGLSRKVFRMSIRLEPGLVGWVTSFFNVPGVFGSVPKQCWNYLGADCCDLLVAALHRQRNQSIPADRNVASLVSRLKHRVRGTLSGGGQPDRPLRWGKDIHSGDFIAVRYEGYRQFGHIGILWRDDDRDGKLSPADIVLHAGPWPLQAEALSSESFDGEFVILRP